MNRRKAAIAAAGTIAAGALTAGLISVPSAVAAGSSGPQARSVKHSGAAEARGVKKAAARAARAGVDWKDCPADWGIRDGVQCGWVTVPLDYAKPNGKKIRLAVDRARSTGGKAKRQGSLVYNPGGPGGSGLYFPARIPDKNPLWAKAATAYDFVGFDPRGVGHSAPISCADPQEWVKAPKADPVPDSEADKRAQRKLAKEYADGCQERSGELLPQLTTPNAARDLDVIRAALGDKKLNYLGVSYGTYMGAVYAELFPRHIRRMITDSIVNPSRRKIWYDVNLDQDVAFQTRWNDWKKWVAEHDDVYGIGSTPQKVEAAWRELRATAEKHPIGGKVGPAELLGVFQSAPYYDSAWARVASVWSAYRNGDEQPLIDAGAPDMSDVAGNKASENGNAVYNAVECNDAKWPSRWRTWDRDNTRLHAKYPFLTWANAWMNYPCAVWPVKQHRPLEIRARTSYPVLMVQATRDAATPYPGGVELHKRLKGSRLITEKGAGSHGITNLKNSCINERVDAYLLKGTVDRKDVTCGPHATPEPVKSPAKAAAKAEAAAVPTMVP
ncbi:aminopeptidase [Streptomyces qinglanensis]|uniref:Aminopeptidase n=1 Tax=Streptomyces qinglanensis TaxID=943816 RepID=A0A1E7K4S3_9ACTN|nr:alpha/beta hydrolase [Streptomyces qinglanensis]OEU98921.1 aminopeptidase [Streptomyces qinglanensis]OEV23704.1 aminopeptidase [Streptomyces nanshensis]